MPSERIGELLVELQISSIAFWQADQLQAEQAKKRMDVAFARIVELFRRRGYGS